MREANGGGKADTLGTFNSMLFEGTPKRGVHEHFRCRLFSGIPESRKVLLRLGSGQKGYRCAVEGNTDGEPSASVKSPDDDHT